MQEDISARCPSNEEMRVLAGGNGKHETGWHRECVCVCVVWGSSSAWQPDLSLTSSDCSSKPVLEAVTKLLAALGFYLLLFLCLPLSGTDTLFFYTPLSFPTLISPAKAPAAVWEKTLLALSSPVLQQLHSHFPAGLFLVFFFKLNRNVWRLRLAQLCPIPRSHTLNGKLRGSVYSPDTENTKRPHTLL